MISQLCECKEGGYCARYKREMYGRMQEICRGENIDPASAALYRNLWLQQAGEQPLTDAGTAVPVHCPYAGSMLHEPDGSPKLRECESCQGRVRLKMFACTHPAREPDEVTVADCRSCPWYPRQTTGARQLVLKNHLSPGDVLAMTAALHSLHVAHPSKFVTAVDTSADAFFENSPDVTARAGLDSPEEIHMHYPLINQCNQRAVHFLQGYCDFLADVLKVPVPLLTNRPLLYVGKRERAWLNQVQEVFGYKGDFWLVSAGRKDDFTCKFWGTENYQRVVDALHGEVVFVQVGAAEHHHPPLRGVLNLVGETDLRQLVRLVHHAKGVLCGVTLLHHLAAALEKPCVTIMGGREPVQWNAYPKCHLLHTIGCLPCCKDGGCWRSRVVKLNDGSEQDNSLCEHPVPGVETVPRCMALIHPEEAVAKIRLTSYR